MKLPEDRMPEAEVSLRLAFYLLDHPKSNGNALVAIDGAQIRVHGEDIFPISIFLETNGWEMEKQKGKNQWQGQYRNSDKTLVVSAQSGVGDVVATIGTRRIRAESKKGPLIPKKGSPEYPLMREAIGQLMTIEEVGPDDCLMVAVPLSEKFRRLSDQCSERPLIKTSKITFALVGRNGTVEGLSDFLQY
ncbi:hypothetical protein [Gimesia sp.]|uniref:hypothetical protein n=1 Tax=Gimesia sp. TaxID=2024833 RepID=UPI003A8EAADA